MSEHDDPFLERHAHTPLAGRYSLIEAIGRGAAATVYRARDAKHEREVAVKVLHPDLGAAIGGERFAREIALLARLQHPHILPLHDSGEQDGALYFVMPLVRGESLRTKLARERQLPIPEAVRIAREVADALASAHEHGIIHRDIKPENVLLSGGHAMVADFGIALAAPAEPWRRLTETGLAIGTPSYMSPEQASGDAIDARSDVYSLGCVLYEMLAGHAPFAGATPQAIMAQRFVEGPKPLRQMRETIPPSLEAIVRRALNRVPADRYATAREMADALAREEHAAPTVASPAAVHAVRRRWFAAGAAAVVVFAALLGPRMLTPDINLDEALHVVVPFVHRGDSAPRLLNGDNCESLLYEAFARWSDLRLVDPLRVHDAQAQRGEQPRNVSETLRLARQLGAGVVAWGEVREFGDSIRVYGALYDARSEKPLKEHSIRISSTLADASAKFDSLADVLLSGLASGPDAMRGSRGTRTLAAWRAYQEGHAALAQWDLSRARSHFQNAVSLDTAYAEAHLRLAQTMAFAGDSLHLLRPSASYASGATDRLPAREAQVAEALSALAEQRFPDACDRFERLVALDPRDFTALFGLGECQARDPVVVADPSSPSGWRFRASYHAAVRSYERAFQLLPSVQMAFRGAEFQRLRSLLKTDANSLRRGVSPTDSTAFAAYPALAGDTLAFVPWTLSDIASVRPGTVPRTLSDAVAHSRNVLLEITTSWIRAFPSGGPALEAHARVLEMTGALTGTEPEHSALAAVQRARSLGGTEDRSPGLELLHLRLLLKIGDWHRARALADSMVSTLSPTSGEDARESDVAAALTGRTHLTADLLQRSARDFRPSVAGQQLQLALPVIESGRRLLAYASLGAPADSISQLIRRTDTLIVRWVEPRLRDRARQALLEPAAALAFPVVGVGEPHRRASADGDYILFAQRLVASGDAAGARRVLDRVRQEQQTLRPGDVTIDALYLQARLALSLGDTASAVRQLGAALDALPTLGPSLTTRVPEAAALVRAMALRAELASRMGDRATARRWAEPVVVLWSGGDSELSPVVDRMRQLAGSGR